MFMYLAKMIDMLESAGIEQGAVALIINEHEEKLLLEEVKASCGVQGVRAHNSSFMGWRIIVKGEQ